MKTDREIIDDCNRLAHKFYNAHGYRAKDGFEFWTADRSREQFMWTLAAIAYEHIEGTPVDDAVTNLESDAEDAIADRQLEQLGMC